MPDAATKRNDPIDVRYVARLARLALTDDERRTFQPQLDQILGYVRKIGELDLEAVEPTSHPRLMQNVFREDVAGPSLNAEAVLANAPASFNGQFKVPKIVE
jgi:aspartyl-tRNA(Asn)/glutamyl-tRNA(Gln) amidotransferase subunit C